MSDPILATHGLSRSFGALKATDNVSIDLRAGEIHAIIGPNGAGKSTLIQQISGALAPDQGRIELLGEDITRLSTVARARAGLGRTFQISALAMEDTVFENAMLASLPARGHPRSSWRAATPLAALSQPPPLPLDPVGPAPARPLSPPDTTPCPPPHTLRAHAPPRAPRAFPPAHTPRPPPSDTPCPSPTRSRSGPVEAAEVAAADAALPSARICLFRSSEEEVHLGELDNQHESQGRQSNFVLRLLLIRIAIGDLRCGLEESRRRNPSGGPWAKGLWAAAISCTNYG